MVIRPVADNEYDWLVNVWLESSKIAHHFIPDHYWEAQASAIRHIYIPNSETWVNTDNQHNITGFFSLSNHTLAAIFVSPIEQGKGIGQALLEKAKSLRPSLELYVYLKNAPAIAFYTRHGFCRVSEQIDANTGEIEIKMQWTSGHS